MIINPLRRKGQKTDRNFRAHTDITQMAPKTASAHLVLDGSV